MLKLTFLFCLLNAAVFAQNHSSSKCNVQSTPDFGYGIHFEFKNHTSSISDLDLFKTIDFQTLEEQRLTDSDVEIYLSQIDKTLILYSLTKTIDKKKEIKETSKN